MTIETTLRGKTVKILNNGEILVNRVSIGVKQWQSDSSRYSNLSGQEIKKIKGQDLESALVILGKIGNLLSEKNSTLEWSFFSFIRKIKNL